MNRAEVQASIEKRDKISGLNLGQRIVVKAWMDPEFKVREIVDLEIYAIPRENSRHKLLKKSKSRILYNFFNY